MQPLFREKTNKLYETKRNGTHRFAMPNHACCALCDFYLLSV